MSKARKHHRQPWWKNKRRVRLGRQWLKFDRALAEVFPDGYTFQVFDCDLPQRPDHGDDGGGDREDTQPEERK